MRSPESLSRRTALQLGLAGLASAPALARGAGIDDGWKGAGLLTETFSNATLILPDGSRVVGGGLRVEEGLIVEIGAAVRGGTDLGGAWIVPGLVDAGCQVGLFEIGLESETHDDAEGGPTVTADARIRDAYYPGSAVIPVTRVLGITTVVVFPSGGKLIRGQGATFHLAGRTVEEALVQSPTGLCIEMGRAAQGGEGGPTSRMGTAMKLRELLGKVKLPPDPPAPKKKKGGGEKEIPPDADLAPGDLVLRQLLRREIKAVIQADRSDDLLAAAELAKAWNLDAVILGGAEAWVVADELAASGIPLLLGPATVQPDSFEHLHARYDNAARLHRAGVPFALRTGANHFARGLPVMGAIAVAHGLPWEAAIAALTKNAGEILALPGVGRLGEGDRATFSVTSGDPLQPRTRHQRMLIDGRECSMETRQTRLLDRYRVLR